MAKSAAATYSKQRRDNEIQLREALEALIPDQYFTAEVMEKDGYNQTTKVLAMIKSYLEDLQSADKSNDTLNDPVSDSDVSGKQPFSIPKKDDSGHCTDEQVQQLRQVATRLVQKVEEKIRAGDGISKQLTSILDNANDLMIDTISNIESA